MVNGQAVSMSSRFNVSNGDDTLLRESSTRTAASLSSPVTTEVPSWAMGVFRDIM